MDGVIEGGWSFVWACYVLTWLTIASYGISAHLRATGPEPAARDGGGNEK